MVKATTDPEFSREFEKELKKNTVYVYMDTSTTEAAGCQVFSLLKNAKKYAESRFNEALKTATWRSNAQAGQWSVGHHYILRKKIIRA